MPRRSTLEVGRFETTRDEIAAELGLSRERVRQLEVQALRKCRDWCERNGYAFEDLLLPGERYRSAASRVAEAGE